MISFNTAKLIKDFRGVLTKALLQLAEEVLVDAEGKMFTPEGRADLELGPIEQVAGIISAYIVGGPWAILDEYGSGSLMDTQNPHLDEYRNSDLWNPARYDLAIRGRPEGSYTNMFGETRTSTGKLEGRNLENVGDLTGNINLMPHPPSHALETAMRWMASGRFQTVIGEVFKDFPWENYLIIKEAR